MGVILAILFFQDPRIVKHQLEPWDIQDPENNVMFGNIALLASDSQYLYLVNQPGPEILVFKKDGTFHKRIYRRGEGPNDFGSNVFGLTVENGLLWVVGSKPKANLLTADGEDLENISLSTFNVELQFMPHHLAMDAKNSVLVTPAWPRSGALGMAYHFDGRVLKKIDVPVDLPRERYQVNKGSSDSMWARDGAFWYCALKYFPEIRQYDSNFTLVKTIPLVGPEIDDLFVEHQENYQKGEHPYPLLKDFAVQNGRIVVLVNRAMYELNSTTGELEARHFFFHKQPNDELETPRLTLNRITFLDDQTLVLGHYAMMWDHDLWRITLPERKKL